ncbi:Uncharacterised protein [Vibrio cholerae]|nr:Uncharacterised protein [Vibrio cholerae]CSI71415.1 Uncharacterised protein [Vibrio cholerae]
MDLSCQVFVFFAHSFHQYAFDVVVQIVHDVGSSFQATNFGRLCPRLTRELFLHDFVQLGQR